MRKFLSLILCLLLFCSNYLISFAYIRESEMLPTKQYCAKEEFEQGYTFNYTVDKTKTFDVIGKDDTKLQIVRYNIDVISNSTKKLIGNGEIDFDVTFSPKNESVSITNYDFTFENSDNVEHTSKSGINGIIGNKTDTAIFGCYITYNAYPINFKITADKNGNTYLRLQKKIDIDDKSYDDYMQFQGFKKIDKINYGGEQNGYQKYQDLFSLADEYALDNSNFENLVFKVKEYEVPTFLLKASMKNGRKVSDLKAKETNFVVEIRTKKDNEYIATLKINSDTKFSQTEKYTSLSSNASHSGSIGDWVITCRKGLVWGNYSDMTMQQHNICVRDKEKAYNFLLTVKCDTNGNVSLSKPVSVT